MRTIAFFWQYFKRYKLSFVIVLLMMVTATVFQVLFPVYVGQAVQHLVELGRAFAEKGETDQILSTFGSVMGSVLVSELLPIRPMRCARASLASYPR